MLSSFKNAFVGLFMAIKSERNMKVHLVMAFLVTFLGLYFEISRMEWLVQTLTISAVMGAEIFNTSIEKLCDILHPEKHIGIGQTKDLAAGAVLIISIAAVIIGLVIYLPRMYVLLN